MKIKKLLISCTLALCLLISACGSSSSGSNDSSSSSTNSKNDSGQTLPSEKSPFELYNKVTLGMTKDQVDSLLGVTPTPETTQYALKNSYNYMTKDNYGVYVAYNDKNQAFTKTVVGTTTDKLAPYTSKHVTEAECDKITKGMSKEEVVKILGSEGVECSRTATKCMTTCNSPEDYKNYSVIIRWGNKDATGVQVVFLADGTASIATYLH